VENVLLFSDYNGAISIYKLLLLHVFSTVAAASWCKQLAPATVYTTSLVLISSTNYNARKVILIIQPSLQMWYCLCNI